MRGTATPTASPQWSRDGGAVDGATPPTRGLGLGGHRIFFQYTVVTRLEISLDFSGSQVNTYDARGGVLLFRLGSGMVTRAQCGAVERLGVGVGVPLACIFERALAPTNPDFGRIPAGSSAAPSDGAAVCGIARRSDVVEHLRSMSRTVEAALISRIKYVGIEFVDDPAGSAAVVSRVFDQPDSISKQVLDKLPAGTVVHSVNGAAVVSGASALDAIRRAMANGTKVLKMEVEDGDPLAPIPPPPVPETPPQSATIRFMLTVPDKYVPGATMKVKVEGKVVTLTVPKKLPPNRSIIVDGNGQVVDGEKLANSSQAPPAAAFVRDYSASIVSGDFREEANAKVATPKGLIMRSLSFQRKNKAENAEPPAAGTAITSAPSAAEPVKRASLLRSLSFGRKTKGDVHFEADVFKEQPNARMGMRIADPEDEKLQGVIISQIDRSSVLRKKLKPGDLIMSINGVAVADRAAALAALRTATGVILLSLMRRPMPPGWTERCVMVEGEIAVLYKNKKEKLKLLSHPHAKQKEGAARSTGQSTEEEEEEEDDDDDDDSEEEAHAAEPPTPRLSSADSKDGAQARYSAYSARNSSSGESGTNEYQFRSTSL